MAVQLIDWERVTLHEPELPADWSSIVATSFTAVAPYYDHYLRQFPNVKAMEETVDGMLVERIKVDDYARIANIGVGGGERLRRIVAKTGKSLYLVGLGISQGMRGVARKNGICAVQHDMTTPLPFKPGSLDAVLWLAGDFGYLMGPVNGKQIRQDDLQQVYESLAPGGMLFAEMKMQDTLQQQKPGRVRRDRRRLLSDGEPVGDYDFYTKMFRFRELQELMEASPFGAANSTLFYVLSHVESEQGPDFKGSGKVVAVYKGFKGFELTQIHADPANPREWYNGILIGRKGR